MRMVDSETVTHSLLRHISCQERAPVLVKQGKCVPGLLIDAADLCAEGGSMLLIIRQVEFKGVILSEMSHYEALIVENEMGSVVSVKMNTLTLL